MRYRSLKNIHSFANEAQKNLILDSGLLQTCIKRLDWHWKIPLKTNLELMSNILCCEDSQLQHYLEIGVFEKIINLMKISTIDIRTEAAFCLANSTTRANVT